MIEDPVTRESPKGDVVIVDGRMRVVFRRSYSKPIEKVWAALTLPERLADWFGPAEVDLRVGGSIVLRWPNGFSSEMRIDCCDPPHTLAWIWHLDGIDTSVRFELTQTSSGCDLVLTHTNVDPEGDGSGVRAGWHAHLEGLADCLDGHATAWSVKTAREKRFASLYVA
jgi:uncharacterized protein YndB with AHSA1/START domain